ncbi:SusC/RagA family TonB-linked outer membrane protein [Flavobacterium caseinilyticum]|uniref:SusC/RagA family TonB-linked outer membrane protein n=1 Tax=Flavobacterium caseinilyticum TaxID=2541732 RepID=A0A4R5B1B5_9FLAO|nr:SusC/RagA family TonB-linked outer membrane protein [Flavobacterium caseinilyticum]TDD78803.1 SusC/RagA family TonB-linked outer membrane protein [Flavobacterium caseinilyticum]
MRSKFKWIFSLLLALSMQFVFAQEKTVTGVVSDASGPVPGVNVIIKGSKAGTQTDFDGKYSIRAKAGDVLIYSFVGMSESTRTVGASNTINVVMQDGARALAEVVVQGYRTVTKKAAVTADAQVSSKTIENRPNANAVNTIQGQLAGVNITASTGQPGAKSSVVIRGVGTITGNSDPLYVIDGFPSNSDNFRSINPNDIETMAVLKDAAAISEYGNRGSNGVIVVNTKKGKFGDPKTTFRYSTQYGVGELQKPKYSYANAKQLLKIEQNFGAGLGATLSDAEIAAYNINTDWVDYFFDQSTSTSHNISVENSNKNITSFTSLGYFEQDGILQSTGLQRFTVRNNINGKSANDRFKYQVNTAVGFSKNREATNLGEGAINRNFVLGAFIGAPYVSPDVYQGSQSALDYYNNTPGLLATPIMLIDKLQTYKNQTEEIRVDVATDFSYDITKDLVARVRLNGQVLENRFFQAEFPGSFNALLFQAAGQAFTGFEDVNQRREFFYNNLFQLNYGKEIGDHTFNLNANMEYNHSRVNSNNFRQRGLIPGIFVPNTGAGYAADTGTNDFYVPQISAGHIRNDLVSYFGSFDYDFQKKYGVVASFRRDGSSRFIGDLQWGNFWSVGGRWNIDEEAFMDDVSFINVLKLRGSYGTVGNQRIIGGTVFAGIQPPAFADIYSVANNTYNGGTGYAISLGYPPLQWETTTQWNAGLDFEMFTGRLRGAFDYYNRQTTDLFLFKPITPTAGASGLTQNTDVVVTNKGVELNLGYDLIKNQEKGITLTVRANGSYNDNKVSGIEANNGQIFAGGGLYVSENGASINEPFVYKYLGVNPVNGNLLFQDASGNPTENPVQADKRRAGINNLPVYQGGFGLDFDYKGFFISSLFTYAFDVARFDYDLDNLYAVGNIGQFTVSDEMLNAWTSTNTNTNVPALTAGNLGLSDESDRFLKDASYIRLRNVQVGYNVPQKFLQKTFMTGVSLSLQGENLFNITKWQGFDPESSRTADVYQYPTPRLFTFGLDVKF